MSDFVKNANVAMADITPPASQEGFDVDEHNGWARLPRTPMIPAQAAHIHLKAGYVPRYLFRAGSVASRGGPTGNSETLISPLHPTPKYTFKQDGSYYASFTSMPWERASLMLNSHLKWTYDRPSGFSSWSSSLLDVLMHAIRRRDEKQANMLVYVLDTEKLKDQGRIFSATRLMEAFGQHNVRPNGKTIRKQTFGEFLIYGELTADDGFTAVKFESLFVAGFEWHFKTLVKRIHREHNDNRVFTKTAIARNFFFHSRHKKKQGKTWKFGPTTSGDGTEYYNFVHHFMHTLRALGRCFGPTWEAVMTIALACTRRRYVDFASQNFDLWPLLRELKDVPLPPLGEEQDVEKMPRLDVPDDRPLREDHVQMLKVWRLLERYQRGELEDPEAEEMDIRGS